MLQRLLESDTVTLVEQIFEEAVKPVVQCGSRRSYNRNGGEGATVRYCSDISNPSDRRPFGYYLVGHAGHAAGKVMGG